ncbi:MAG: chromate transporter [Oscillospiraceae bacterium]|nr:chromate transporter [Oscillospiraceae bacterium]
MLFELFINFFQIGLFTFGGGYAMIPLITEKAVRMGWASPEQLVDYIAVSESTPGPFSINAATFIGIAQYGFFGAAAAVFGLVLPSFIIILIIAKFFTQFMDYTGVKAAVRGLNPAVIGLILSAAVSISFTSFNINLSADFYKELNLTGVFIFLIVLVLSRIKKLKFNTYKIIITSAVLGVVFYTLTDLFNIILT